MTVIENRWTVGNIASIAAVILGLTVQIIGLVWWAASISSDVAGVAASLARQKIETDKQLEMQSTAIQRQYDVQTNTFNAYDVRLRDVERGYTRLDEKTSMILETVREVRDTLKSPATKD